MIKLDKHYNDQPYTVIEKFRGHESAICLPGQSYKGQEQTLHQLQAVLVQNQHVASSKRFKATKGKKKKGKGKNVNAKMDAGRYDMDAVLACYTDTR